MCPTEKQQSQSLKPYHEANLVMRSFPKSCLSKWISTKKSGVTSRIGLGRDAKGKGGFKGITMEIRRDTGEIAFFGYYPFD